MTTRRLLANLLAGIVLAVILFALMAIIIDERLSKQRSENESVTPFEQAIPFKGEKS